MNVYKTLAFTVLCLRLATSLAQTPIEIDVDKFFGPSCVTLAPEMLDDAKCAIMTYRESRLFIRIIEHKGPGRECPLPRSLKLVYPYDMHRVSSKYVTLDIFAFNEDVPNVPTKLLLINTETCEFQYAYDSALPRGDRYIFTSSNSSDERFTLIANDKQFCGGDDWCRLFFDPTYRRRESLGFDFRSSLYHRLEPATESLDARLFVAVVVDETRALSLRLYDFSTDRQGPLYKELYVAPGFERFFLTNPTFIRNSQMIFGGLSLCRSEPETIDSWTLTCTRFRENGSGLFTQQVARWRGDEHMIHIQTVPNGLVLFSMKFNCMTREACATVQAELVTRDSDSGKEAVQIQHREYELQCNAFWYSSLQFVSKQASKPFEHLQYLCKRKRSSTPELRQKYKFRQLNVTDYS